LAILEPIIANESQITIVDSETVACEHLITSSAFHNLASKLFAFNISAIEQKGNASTPGTSISTSHTHNLARTQSFM
jgi:hypothetical protein